MKPIVQVEGLGKQFRIGLRDVAYDTLRDSLVNALRAPFRARKRTEMFWALRDLSFEARPGEVIGIVGSNGAGKSTLLKILARITGPTKGEVRLWGRVGSLIEVGTGFHGELTGRENVFLNGAILGMSRAEIARKFDDIVDFAEVGRFIDTPAKRYSTGMYLRLAFAVAAFLESEILLVDEVLAVGDASFQKKCLGKMRDISEGGRTVFFVSHNMAAIESLCTRCIMIRDGRLQDDDTPHAIITRYLAASSRRECTSVDMTAHPGRRASSKPLMRRAELHSDDEPCASIRMGGSFSVRVHFESAFPLRPYLTVVLKNSFGTPVFCASNRIATQYEFETAVTDGAISCHFRDLPLVAGTYALDIFFGDGYEELDRVHDAISLEVTPADVFGSGQIPDAADGTIYWPASWTLDSKPEATLSLHAGD